MTRTALLVFDGHIYTVPERFAHGFELEMRKWKGKPVIVKTEKEAEILGGRE
jgi:hypothetical protein